MTSASSEVTLDEDMLLIDDHDVVAALSAEDTSTAAVISCASNPAGSISDTRLLTWPKLSDTGLGDILRMRGMTILSVR